MGDTSWITITVGGAAAGATVAALTYSATATSSKALATTSSITCVALGELIGLGATYFGNPVAASTVRVIAHAASKTSDEAIRVGGSAVAAGAAVAMGALTALTITVGTRVIQYSVEYGGKISKEVAQQLSESYLKYKIAHTQFDDSTPIEQIEDEQDWVVLQLPSGEPVSTE